MTDSLNKDFSMPTSATSGINDYDQEGTKPKKSSKRTTMTPVKPANAQAENDLPDFDVDGTDKAPGDGASKGKKRPKTKPSSGGTPKTQQRPKAGPQGNDEGDSDEWQCQDSNGDTVNCDDENQETDEFDDTDDNSDDDNNGNKAKKLSPDAKDANGADAFDNDPNSRGYGKRKFSDKKRTELAASGAAEDDGSYPIQNAKDLKNAISAYGRSSNKAKTKAHIISRAKSLGLTGSLPDDWKKSDEGDMQKYAITELDEAGLEKFFKQHEAVLKSDELVKGVYDVASLGALITQLNSLALGAAIERQIEGDDSKVPEDLRSAAADLLSVLSDMASEESEEIRDGTTAEDVMNDTQSSMTPGLYRNDIGDLAKAMRDSLGLSKAGARNSKKDLETLQKCHDALCELGAECAKPSPHDQNGNSVDPQETVKMVTKSDTISAEGNKRGAAVSDPKASMPGPNSTNEEDAEDTSEQGQEKPASDAKKSKARMAADAMKRKKAQADMDEDEDEDMDEDEDEDEDEDFPPPKKAKKKAKKSFDAEDLAKAVAAGVAAAMAQVLKGDGAVKDIRLPPNLMQVGKDGSAQKFESINLDDLRKSVKPVQGAQPLAKWEQDPNTKQMVGDNDTVNLIKAIRSNPAFRLKESDIPSSF